MKERTLRILEFNKIKDKVEKYAITSSGKEMVHSLEPFKSTYEVEKKLEETNEALELLITKGAPPLKAYMIQERPLKEQQRRNPYT